MNIEKLIEKFGPPPPLLPDTEETTMNDVEKSKSLARFGEQGIFKSVEGKYKTCNCSYHGGEVVFVVRGLLCNDLPFVVQVDHGGYHVSIGREVDSDYFPDGVDPQELERIIYEAIR